MPDESNPVRNIGRVQKFVVGTDFKACAEQLEFFFVANGVTVPKQKKVVLLSNLPAETYQLAKDLVAPTSLRGFSHIRHDRRASPKAIEAPEIWSSRQVRV